MKSLRKTISKFAWGVLERCLGGPPKVETVEEYRERFKVAPIGQWSTPYDCGPWPSVSWQFCEDGHGKMVHHSGMGDCTEFFEWKPQGERCIEVQMTEVIYEVDPCPNDEMEEDDEGPSGWVTISYDFKRINHYAPTVVMYGEMLKAFSDNNYLEYAGPAPSTLER
jgi:hypothetical protein